MTATATAPAELAGVVQVIVVAFTTLTAEQGLPPTATVAPARYPVPVIVIDVPPAKGPAIGVTFETVGAAWNV